MCLSYNHQPPFLKPEDHCNNERSQISVSVAPIESSQILFPTNFVANARFCFTVDQNVDLVDQNDVLVDQNGVLVDQNEVLVDQNDVLSGFLFFFSRPCWGEGFVTLPGPTPPQVTSVTGPNKNIVASSVLHVDANLESSSQDYASKVGGA